MNDILTELISSGKINPPPWIDSATQYLCLTGSHAYGFATEFSDIDIYGFCVPPIEYILPHTAGIIEGFGRQVNKFEQFQQEGIEYNDKIYDITIYNITKFFQLCMENNPNMIDCIFVPNDCIIRSTTIGNNVFWNRNKFLHKGAFWKFTGYAAAQLKKIENKKPEGKRKIRVDKFGFDTKYASHLYRLADECEQILTSGTLNLRHASGQMVLIRDGKVPLSELKNWFVQKELELKNIYDSTEAVPHGPDEQKIKALLIKCIEMYHGRLDKYTFGWKK